MEKSPVYNQEGKEAGAVTLPEAVFGASWNADLVHQVVVAMQANARIPFAHTKDRGEVRGGGRKPWRQKGTGRARHGSRRSPIWKGGGVTHGPRNEKNYTQKINSKMRAKALYAALSKKLADNEILFVDTIALSAPQTKAAKEILSKLSAVSGFEALQTKRKNAALIVTAERDENVERSFRNIGNIVVGETRNLNPLDVLSHKFLIIVHPDASVQALKARTEKASAHTSPVSAGAQTDAVTHAA